jgi:hypothetical protein
MGEPDHRVPADVTLAFHDVRLVDVYQAEKDAQSALVCALGQHDFIAFMKHS